MLRLTPSGHMKIEQAQNFEFCFGGAEANTAVLLARLGLKSAFVTKLPDNPIGRACLNKLRENQVETKHIIMDNSNKARWGYIFANKVRPSALQEYFTTAGIPVLPLWAQRTPRIGKAFLRQLHGCILPALLPLWAKARASALKKPAKRRAGLKFTFHATLITAPPSGTVFQHAKQWKNICPLSACS